MAQSTITCTCRTPCSSCMSCKKQVSRCSCDVDVQATFDRFMYVLQQFIDSLALTCASRNSRNLSPITTFFSFMHNDLNFHVGIIPLLLPSLTLGTPVSRSAAMRSPANLRAAPHAGLAFTFVDLPKVFEGGAVRE